MEMIGCDDGKNPIDFHHIQSRDVMLGIGIIVSRRLIPMEPLATELAEQSLWEWQSYDWSPQNAISNISF